MANASNPVSSAVARALLEIGAVVVSPDRPFTWASGLRAPIYCDNRLTIARPDARTLIARAFCDRIRGLDEAPDAIVGTATAGIPQAAWVAAGLELPLAYVRSEAKKHGKGKQVEGFFRSGAAVIVIEDLVSTGGSSVAVVEALRQEGMKTLRLMAIFTYGLPASIRRFKDADVPFEALCDLEDLLAEAERMGRLTRQEVAAVRDWQVDPVGWSERIS
jgi:orotate phosphoribosyltransferase